MTGDDLRISEVETCELRTLCRDILMACSVEAVATDTVLVVIFVWKSIHIGVCWHCLVEGRIKHTDLRNRRKHCTYRSDTEDVCWIMERCEHRAFLKLRDNLVRNQLAAHEILRSMNDTMTYSLDVLKSVEHSVFLVKKSINDSLDTNSVVCYRHFLHKFLLSGRLMLEAAHFHSDSLDETFREQIVNLFVLHIEKLILQRRTSTIDY